MIYAPKKLIFKFIETAIKFWVRSQCDYIKELNIDIQGNSLNLLRGELKGASLLAKEIKFKNLDIHFAEITTGLIRFKLNTSLNKKKFELQENFEIKGRIIMEDIYLKESLSTYPFEWLGELIAKELLQAKSLDDLKIKDGFINIYASDKTIAKCMSGSFTAIASEGTIVIKKKDSTEEISLPMDPNINIERVFLNKNQLCLEGISRVNF